MLGVSLTEPSPSPGDVDLRSDAVTRPSPAMWAAMQSDPLDWNRGSDATVAELEQRVATLTGKPAGLFVPSGTMANTLAACGWTQPGDHFVVDRYAHVLRSEGEAYARVARILPHAVSGTGGFPAPEEIEAVLESEARLSMVWLENTHTYAGGTVVPPQVEDFVAALRLRVKVHLDGARLWNAAVAAARPLAELAAVADSVSVNLNKGLGCPAGAVLCGPVDFIASARDLMGAFGGSMAQPGLLAACGLVGLDDFESQVLRDHALAARLADGLRSAGLEVARPDTNIVLVAVQDAEATRSRLAHEGVFGFVRDPSTVRFVTHRDVDSDDIERAVAVADAFHRS